MNVGRSYWCGIVASFDLLSMDGTSDLSREESCRCACVMTTIGIMEELFPLNDSLVVITVLFRVS